MNLYNSLTKKVEEIQPISSSMVSVYTCGPTVYDYPHIGNWFTFIRYDLMVRTLMVNGYKVKWVFNITDVGHLVSDDDVGEDKLEKGAKREGKSAWDVAKFYGDNFINGLNKLNFITPSYIPRATDHIKEQIELIQKLESKGYTYIISDGVYFDTSKFPKYTSFANLDLDAQQTGSRIEKNLEKRNSSDFAMWKLSPKDKNRDMEWQSPWGIGFPGWHIECSAMSIKYLGETIDIHSGGIDHIPVHHTNEIAQSEAATGKTFSNIWMHTNHILINEHKISKSLGNGITLEQIEAKGISLQAFRLHVLESHYRSQSKFSWESLTAAESRLRSYRAFADLVWQLPASVSNSNSILEESTERMLKALQNDLDTPTVLAEISMIESESQKLVKLINRQMLLSYLVFIDAALGLKLSQTKDLNNEQKTLLTKRELARKNNDWLTSDSLRDELQSLGVGIKDTSSGAIWFRL